MNQSEEINSLLERAEKEGARSEWANALKLYKQVHEQDEANQAAIEGIRQMTKNVNGERIRSLLIKAQELLTQEDWDGAEQCYQDIRRLDGNHQQAKNNLAKVAQKREQDKYIRQLIDEGDQAYQKPDYREAKDKYEKAINLGVDSGIKSHYAVLLEKHEQARQLYSWQQQVDKVLENIKTLKKKPDFDSNQALEDLKKILESLPEDEPYQPMGDRLREEQRGITERISHDDLLKKINNAFDAQDYEEVLRLAESVPPGSPVYQRVASFKMRADDTLRVTKPNLDAANKALDNEDWPKAIAELKPLQTNYPDSPLWRRPWLQAGRGMVQQLLNNGRQANAVQEFKQAHVSFQEAKSRLDELRKVFPGHEEINLLSLEADDLVRIAKHELDAHSGGDPKAAVMELEAAQEIIDLAKRANREYTLVGGDVRKMLQDLKEQIEETKKDELALVDGERLLENKDLVRAVDAFRPVTLSSNDTQRKRAEQGINKAEAQIVQFHRHMDRGQAVAELPDQVEEFQKAYDLWPTGPMAVVILEKSLVEVGYKALDDGDNEAALGYFDRALAINPDNKAAQDGRRKPGLSARVTAAVKINQEKLVELMGDPKTTSQSYEPELGDLKTLLEETKSNQFADMRARLKEAIKNTEVEQGKWRTYESGSAKAHNAHAKGDWAKAVSQLGAAMNAFGKESPLHVQSLYTAWSGAAATIHNNLNTAIRELAAARQAYETLPTTLPTMPDVEPARGALRQAALAIDAARQAAENADQGLLPVEFQTITTDIEGLRKRLAAIDLALKKDQAHDTLTSLKEQIIQLGEDSTLIQLRDHFQEKTQATIPTLVKQAQEAWDSGQTGPAMSLLRKANELGAGKANLLRQWTDDEALREELDGLDSNYNDLILKKSYFKARENRVKVIEQLRAKGRLDPGMVQLLDALLQLNLGKDEDNEKARNYRSELVKFGAAGGWAAERASNAAGNWAEVSRHIDLRNLASSALSISDFIDAHQKFSQLMEEAKDEEERKEYETKADDVIAKMIAAMRTSAQSRLDRAKDLLEKENYDLVRAELDEMKEFHDKVSIRFKGRYETDDTARIQIATAQEYRLKADLLQEHYNRVTPLIENARKLLVEGHHDEAARELNKAGDFKEDAPKLAEKVESLRSHIQTARAENASNRIRDEITRATTAITLAGSLEEFDTAIDALRQIDPGTLSLVREEDRAQYREALRTAGEAREKMAEGQELAKQAAQAFEAKDYANAETYYKQAINIERSGSVRAALTQQLDKVSKQQTRQAQGRAALRRAEIALDEGLASDDDHLADGKAKFFEARGALNEAKEFGLERGDLMILAKVGLLWISARQEIINQFYVDAENGFKSARDALSTHPDQNDDRVHEFNQQIANWLEKYKTAAELEEGLRAAEASLLSTRLDKTRLDEAEQSANKVLVKFPRNERAKGILAVSAIFRAAIETLETGDSWKNDPGKYKEAVRQLEATLERLPKNLPGYMEVESRPPLYIEVESRKKEFDRLVELNGLRDTIEVYIAEGDFDGARAKLKELEVEGDEARQLREHIEEAEKRHEAQVIQPIRQLLNQKRFPEALSLSDTELNKAKAPSIKQDIEKLRTTVVDQWALHTRNEVDEKLRDKQAHTREILEGHIAELQQRLDQKPGPSDEALQTVSQTQRAVKIRLLELRLVQIEQASKKEALDEAALLNDLEELESDIEIVKTLSASADDNDQVRRLTAIRNRAFSLQTGIRDKIEKTKKESDAAERNRLMKEARQKHENAVGKDDLLQSKGLALAVLAIIRYQKDPEAEGLRDQIDKDLRELSTTEDALQRSSGQLHLNAYDQARSTLRALYPISRLRKKQVEDRLELLDLLLRAQDQRDKARWEDALADYESANEKAPDLQTIWSGDFTICRQETLNEYERLIDSDLQRERPDVAAARRRLEFSTMTKLATVSEFNQRFESIKNRIQSHEYLVNAIDLLDKDEDGNAQQAADLLGKARAAVHHERHLHSDLVLWEALVQALIAWEGNDWKGAEALFNTLQYPVSDTRQARELNDKIREHNEKLTDVAKYLEVARDSLKTMPLGRVAAIAALRQVLDLDPDNEAALTMANQLTDQLRREIEQDRAAARYSDALTRVKLLRDLPPNDSEFRDPETILTNERKTRLAEAYEAADSALKAYRLNDLDENLKLIKTILHPETDDRLTQLQQQRTTLAELLKLVDAKLLRAHQHLDKQEWSDAKTSVEAARKDAPGYRAVVTVITLIQAAIIKQSSQLLADDALKEAYELADLGRALDPNPDEGLLTVQREIRKRSSEVFQRKYDAITRALDLWQLEEARAWLAEDWYLLDQFEETKVRRTLLAEVQRVYEEQNSKTPAMLEKMKAGWQMLNGQQFEQAARHFQQVANEAVKAFPEANEWVGYAQSLQNAITAVARNSLDEATAAVTAGKGFMTAKPEHLLASCLDGQPHLAARRRQAAWNIARLGTQLQQMMTNKDQVKGLTSRGQLANDEAALDEAAALLNKNITLQKNFPLILSNPTTPPDDFDRHPSAIDTAAGPPAGAVDEALPPTEADEALPPTEVEEATGSSADVPAVEPLTTQLSEPPPPAPVADEPLPSSDDAMPTANDWPLDALERVDDGPIPEMEGIDNTPPDTDEVEPGQDPKIDEFYDTSKAIDGGQTRLDRNEYGPDEVAAGASSDNEEPVGDGNEKEANDAAIPPLTYEQLMGDFKASPMSDYED